MVRKPEIICVIAVLLLSMSVIIVDLALNNFAYWNIIVQVAMAVFAACIFYIIQQFIPNIKRTKTINKILNKKIKEIASAMKTPLNVLAKTYIKNFESLEKLSDEDYSFITKIIDPTDNIKDLYFDNYGNQIKNLKVVEYLKYCHEKVNMQMASLLNEYGNYLKPKLIKKLNEIENSDFQKSFINIIGTGKRHKVHIESGWVLQNYLKLSNELNGLSE